MFTPRAAGSRGGSIEFERALLLTRALHGVGSSLGRVHLGGLGCEKPLWDLPWCNPGVGGDERVIMARCRVEWAVRRVPREPPRRRAGTAAGARDGRLRAYQAPSGVALT